MNQGVSSLPHRTMRVGILFGIVGLFAIITSDFFFRNFGAGLDEARVANGLAVAFTVIYQLVISAFLPFSAALISASLVMRYLTAPDGRPVMNRKHRGSGERHTDTSAGSDLPHAD